MKTIKSPLYLCLASNFPCVFFKRNTRFQLKSDTVLLHLEEKKGKICQVRFMVPNTHMCDKHVTDYEICYFVHCPPSPHLPSFFLVFMHMCTVPYTPAMYIPNTTYTCAHVIHIYVTGFAKTGIIAGVRNCSYSPFSSAK